MNNKCLIFCMLLLASMQTLFSMKSEKSKQRTFLKEATNNFTDPVRINLVTMNPYRSSWGHVKKYTIGWNEPYAAHIRKVLIPVLLPGATETVQEELMDEYRATNKSKSADIRYFCLQMENLRRPLESRRIVIEKEWDRDSKTGSIEIVNGVIWNIQGCDIEPDKQCTEIKILLGQKGQPEKNNMYVPESIIVTATTTRVDD